MMTADLVVRIQAASRARLGEIQREFLHKTSKPSSDSETRIKVIDRLADDPRMLEVWAEIGKHEGAGHERDLLKKVKDVRFKINDPEHLVPIHSAEEQIIAIAKNIVTISAWLVLKPPQTLRKVQQNKKIEVVKQHIKNLESIIDFLDDVNARRPDKIAYVPIREFEKEMRALQVEPSLKPDDIQPVLPISYVLRDLNIELELLDSLINGQVQVSKERGLWKERSQIVLMAHGMKKSFGEYHYGIVAKIMTVALGIEVKETAVREILRSNRKATGGGKEVKKKHFNPRDF